MKNVLIFFVNMFNYLLYCTILKFNKADFAEEDVCTRASL